MKECHPPTIHFINVTTVLDNLSFRRVCVSVCVCVCVHMCVGVGEAETGREFWMVCLILPTRFPRPQEKFGKHNVEDLW